MVGFKVIHESLGALILGIVLAFLGVILMLWLVHSWRKDIVVGPWAILGSIVLFVVLSFQMVMFCGARKLKGIADNVETRIHAAVELMGELGYMDVLTADQSQELLDIVTEEFPIIGSYVDVADIRGQKPDMVAEVMVDGLRSYLNRYMVRRIVWSLLCMVVITAIVIRLSTVGYKVNTSRREVPSRNRVHVSTRRRR